MGCEVIFDDSFVSQIFFGRSSPKSKVVRELPASHKECRSFCKVFFILFLLILFIEKFTCPSSIIDSMDEDRRSFVLTTNFCFSAVSKLSHSLITPSPPLKLGNSGIFYQPSLPNLVCCYCRKSPYST